MADYYPLISRAVAGLEKNNGESRRALYERARAALLAQLRGVTPPLAESDITRERLALEESIRKVEAESARQFVEPSRQPPGPKLRPVPKPEPPQPPASRKPEPPQPVSSRKSETRPREEEPASRRYPKLQEESRQEAARRPRTQAPPASASPTPLPEQRNTGSIFDQPLPSEAPQPPRHPLRRPADRRPLSESGLKDFRNVVSDTGEAGASAARPEKAWRDAFAAAPAQPPEPDRPQRGYDHPRTERPDPATFAPPPPQERMFEPRLDPRADQEFSEPMLESAFTLDDSRLLAPKGRRDAFAPPDEDAAFEPSDEAARPRRSYRGLVKGLAAALVVLGLGGTLVWQWPNLVELYRTYRPPSGQAARDASAPAAPKKIQERIEPGAQQATAPGTPTPQVATAVAQKVVLYEEDPDDPNGKRFVGSAIWRTETVTPGPGQPPELAIRADVEVPERKLAMTWSLRRNTDKGLPASHTVEIMFKLPADFPAGGISNVPGILMKQAEQTRGVPLAGLAVKVTNGFYLIGLSNVDTDRERNLQLLKERGWFDIPVVYNNNRRAILAMEKGTPGENVFADAFKAWKQ